MGPAGRLHIYQQSRSGTSCARVRCRGDGCATVHHYAVGRGGGGQACSAVRTTHASYAKRVDFLWLRFRWLGEEDRM